jgi:YHS domain-containing protein
MEVRSKLAKDPVCGMVVDEKSVRWKSRYGDRIYYFCNEGCKRAFDKDPKKFVK